ncbi:DUF4440 domain-containing protein [Halobacillus shinanisalinarum]|uniref:DUF4440 domain-containing protein n=1 Tax=Halobacillus shinanisalinarum TaxID=2932258 RepID=A0ABY4H4C9_9BACI|nr:nuclear transport factor 2 family protein [Halobacillus shinanisalinarum]UOQ95320.1 DUF4440 domain-containing protein [Halobacillus shinanisalinarum]
MNDARKEFTVMHDQFLTEWSKALKNGDTSTIERRMHTDYYVTFFSENQHPMYFDRKEAVEGMRASVESARSFTKRLNNRITRLRNNDNVVVFYEQVLLNREREEMSRLLTIENWRKVNKQWLIIREMEEKI